MNYLTITKDDTLNGDGLRVVLWVAGCSHHCKGCQNSYSWNPNTGVLFTDETINEIFAELSKDYISGLTLSGGDPLYIDNRDTITNLVKSVKEKFPNKTIWLYTGYSYEDIKNLDIINYLDVIIDGEYKEELRDITLPYRGSSNQRIIYLKEKTNGRS